MPHTVKNKKLDTRRAGCIIAELMFGIERENGIMQQLKREIEARILSAGRSEFLSKGYSKATVRTIAKRARISLGNFYTYFKGKNELFSALVQPVYQRIDALKADFFDFEAGQDFRDPLFLNQFIKHTSEALALLLQSNRRDLVLLLDKSGGTPFEDYKMRLIRLIEQDFKEDLAIQKASTEFLQTENGPLFLIARNLVEGIIEIAKHNQSDEYLRRALRHFLHYHFNGLASLLTIEDA